MTLRESDLREALDGRMPQECIDALASFLRAIDGTMVSTLRLEIPELRHPSEPPPPMIFTLTWQRRQDANL